MNDRIHNQGEFERPLGLPDDQTFDIPQDDQPEATPKVTDRVLVVAPEGAVRRMALEALAQRGSLTDEVSSAREARKLADRQSYDAVLIDTALPRRSAYRLCESLTSNGVASAVVLMDARPTLENAVAALRSGACDLVGAESPGELAERAIAAAQRGREARSREERTRRIERLCHKLNEARGDMSREVNEVFSGLVGAYREMSGEVGRVAMASEFVGLVRQELDVEGLLRTTLEFTLAKIGSTNAGIFLPSSNGDFSLGAYINFDCPRDAAEVMLDSLADELAPRYEALRSMTRIDSDSRLHDDLGDASHWLEGRTLLVTGCHEVAKTPGAEDRTGECLAVLALFRDRRTGFTAEEEATVAAISELFTEQLARVIRVHHRHTPQSLEFDDGSDDLDLAA
ncbi:MAG: response regulator [Planctomycetota bacterium]